MKKLNPIISEIDMLYCSLPIPPINDNRDGVFDFTEQQIAAYGQSQTHPSIIYVAAGWNGHKYWMATTPMMHANLENPCIYYGDEDEDGNPPRVFHPISGSAIGVYTVVNNPITKVPNNSTVNSDPDLFLDTVSNTLWMISRENTNAFAVYSQKSLDGQAWTPRGDRSTGFLWKNGVGDLAGKPEFLSPSVVKVGSKIRIYNLSGTSGIYPKDKLRNRGLCWGVWVMEGTTFEGAGDFQYVKKAAITGKRNIEPWHMDIFVDSRTGYYYMICCARNYNVSDSVTAMDVYLAESKDGWNFHMYSRPILTNATHYRPTAFIRPSDNKLVIYWSVNGGAPTTPESYPNGESDVPVNGWAIGLSYNNFDDILSILRYDNILGYQE